MDPLALLVIFLYAIALVVVLVVSPRLAKPRAERRRWWRSVRFWAAVVAVVQMAVYALWG